MIIMIIIIRLFAFIGQKHNSEENYKKNVENISVSQYCVH